MRRTPYLQPQGVRVPYTVDDPAAAIEMVVAAETVTLDIETYGLVDDEGRGWRIKCVQFCSLATDAHVLGIEHAGAIRECLTRARRLIVHNAAFDIAILVRTGLMRLDDIAKVHDTIVDSRLAFPSDMGGHDLGTLCGKLVDPAWKTAKGMLERRCRESQGLSTRDMHYTVGVDSDAFTAYAAADVIMLAALYPRLGAAVRATLTDHPFPTSGDPTALVEREQTINRMMLRRSGVGLLVDFDMIDTSNAAMTAQREQADAELRTYGIDTDLTAAKIKDNAMAVLERRGALPLGYKRVNVGTPHERPSSDQRSLGKVGHPIVGLLEQRSQAERFMSDYATKLTYLARDGRISPQVAVCKAKTGRMSYGSPPLQQYPPACRPLIRFDSPAVSMDWSSIEPFLFANLAGEQGMIDLYERGEDLYLPLVEAARCSRKVAKVVLLGLLYGLGPAHLGRDLGIDHEEAWNLMNAVLAPIPKVAAAITGIKNVGNKFGKVQTWSGRIIPLDPDPRTGGTRFMGYKGVNYTVQGGAYDLLAEALVAIHRAGLDDAVYLAIHDELVVAESAAEDVARIMTAAPPGLCEAVGRTPVLRIGRVPLGTNWAAKEN